MLAITQRAYGAPRTVLTIEERPIPIPSDDQVLVRIHAASVNAGDWHIIRGTPFPVRIMTGLFAPKYASPGGDMAGVVEVVGKQVTQFKVGDAVFGDLSLVGLGSFAQYVCVNESSIAHKPTRLSFEEAAAIPEAGTTALQGLRDVAKVRSGEHVLVIGASGGVGSCAVQIAKAMGAVVTGVCSTRNVDLVRGLGADTVIDYTAEDVAAHTNRYDVIMDAAAFRPFRTYMQALTPTGRYVLVGGSMSNLIRAMAIGPLVSHKHGRRVLNYMAKATQADLVALHDYAEAGLLKPRIDRIVPLSQTPDAVEYVEQGHARGKVVIAM